MSTVNGFQVGSETLKYNYESLDNYNTPNFSTGSSTTYAVGDYVMYNGKLYKCTTATTGGTWVSGSWNEAVLSDDVSDLSRQISDVESAIDDIVGGSTLSKTVLTANTNNYIDYNFIKGQYVTFTNNSGGVCTVDLFDSDNTMHRISGQLNAGNSIYFEVEYDNCIKVGGYFAGTGTFELKIASISEYVDVMIDTVDDRVDDVDEILSDILVDNNLFVSTDVVPNGYYSASNGSFVEDNGYFGISTLIDVSTNRTIYLNFAHDRATDYGFYTCYKEDGTTWAGEGGSLIITNLPHVITISGTNSKYVRISFSTHFSTTNGFIGYTNSIAYSVKNLPAVVQTSGQSTESVMSQKAVTDIIASILADGIQWRDKTLCAFGTSLTDTGNAPNTYDPNGDPTGKYLPYLIEMGQFAELNPLPATSGVVLDHEKSTNFGIAGGSINGHILYYIRYYLHDAGQQGMSRLLGNYADIITIEGSVNDYAGNVPLGQVGDTVPYTNGLLPDGTSEGTFAGACYCAFTEAQEYAPNSLIVFLTDSTGKYYAGNGNNYNQLRKNSLGLYQKDYIDMAVAVAKFVGIPVIECGSESMINAQNPDYLVDWIHHTYLGGYQYAKTIWSHLKHLQPKATSLPNS